MSKLSIINVQGDTVGEVDFPDEALLKKGGRQAVHDVVVAHLAGQRSGSAATRTRAHVAGGGAKPYKQKGTGRARAGSIRSPIWRGGGTVFGPHPRDYAKKVNRKLARQAFRRIMTDKIEAGEIVVVDSLTLGEPKTKLLAGLLRKLGVDLGVLLVADKVDRNVGLAARNMDGVEVTTSKTVNAYQLLRYPKVLATRLAVAELEKRMRR